MRQSFDPQLQKSISETLYKAIVANNTLRQEKQRLEELYPTFIFDYWEASSTPEDWRKYQYLVDGHAFDFKKDATIITDWLQGHIHVRVIPNQDNDYLEFDIPYTWFTDRETILAEFRLRNARQAEKERAEKVARTQKLIGQLETRLRELKGI